MLDMEKERDRGEKETLKCHRIVLFFFSPDIASITAFSVEENDFLVIATDGLWDNLPDATILDEIRKIRVSPTDRSEVNDRVG